MDDTQLDTILQALADWANVVEDRLNKLEAVDTLNTDHDN